MGERVVAYRLSSWESPVRTEPSRLDGRYHRAGELEPTQYFCLHPLGPWAELMRARDLRTPEQVLAMRERTWAAVLDVEGFVRIGFEDAREHGLRPGDLVSTDYRACQRLADRMRGLGVPGLIVPSAALPGTENVVVFGARVAAPYTLEAPVSAIDVPASLTAEDGRPLLSLLERVVYRGERFPQIWKDPEFAFSEPSWARG